MTKYRILEITFGDDSKIYLLQRRRFWTWWYMEGLYKGVRNQSVYVSPSYDSPQTAGVVVKKLREMKVLRTKVHKTYEV